MRIDEYRNICDNVKVSDMVLTSYQNVIDQIKEENARNIPNTQNAKKIYRMAKSIIKREMSV